MSTSNEVGLIFVESFAITRPCLGSYFPLDVNQRAHLTTRGELAVFWEETIEHPRDRVGAVAKEIAQSSNRVEG